MLCIIAPWDVHVLCTLYLFSSSLPPLPLQTVPPRYAYDVMNNTNNLIAIGIPLIIMQ